MLLPQLPNCTSCDLHKAGCKNVGLPTAVMGGGPATLVFMGHQPGRDEDFKKELFVGPAGQVLRKCFIEALNLQSAATIYLMNLVRCWPLADKPSPAQIRGCHGHLAHDFQFLSTLPGPHILVLLGGETVKAVLNKSISNALRSNGEMHDLAWLPIPWFVVSTYHPAFLLSKRNPNAIHAVADHMQVVCDHLSGVATVKSSPTIVPPRNPP